MMYVDKFDSVVVSEKMCFCTPNDTRFQIERKGLNVYGNPVYRLYMNRENMTKIKNSKNKIGRVYHFEEEEKCFLSFTSYNVSSTLKFLFDNCGIQSELK